MPSVRKLTVHSNNLLPKAEKDLTVFSASYGHSMDLSDSSMDYSSIFVPAVDYSMEQENTNDAPVVPRKRQRLDHLSQEEKVMRRKMKNRVAAQSARDRKKAKMNELEEQVLQLEAQKRYLLMENQELKKKNVKLEEMNANLKLRLSLTTTETTQKVVPDHAEERVEEGRPLEHASLISAPQLKEQDLHLLALWMMQYVYLPTIARLMTFLICFSSVATACCSVTLLVPNSKAVKPKSYFLQSSRRPRPWWGPHQRAWNPSKN